MDLLGKLMMMKQIKFSEGNIELLNQRVVLSPADMLSGVTQYLLDYPDQVPEMYENIRTSFGSGWAEVVKKQYGLRSVDYFRWLIDISNIAGWGKSSLISFDEKTMEGTFRTEDALVATKFKGKTTKPIDHIWRALTAGGLSRVFDRDIDWIETKCYAIGDPYCEFSFKPREAFKRKTSVILKEQLPVV